MSTPNTASPSSQRHPSWWEKTVEYRFVLDVLSGSAAEAFPLAGDSETAYGDLLMKSGLLYRLIEFKARSRSISAEKEKYEHMRGPISASGGKTVLRGRFQDLLKEHYPELLIHPGHAAHWFIFAESDGPGLALRAQGYSADAPLTAVINMRNDPLNTFNHEVSGVPYNDMRNYLTLLEETRGGTSAGGGLTLVGVSGDGKAVLTLTADEFKNEPPTPEPAPAENVAGPVENKASSTPKFRK